MKLTQEQKKFYRTIGHELNPIVTIAGKGLTENITTETDRALEQHELIKIKVSVGDREARDEIVDTLCKKVSATLIQRIGNMAIFLRRAKQPNPKLSNLVRYKNL